MSNWIIYSIGFLAQILFSSRLLIQWIQSEKVKKVLTPVLFWQLSLIASFLLFVCPQKTRQTWTALLILL